MADTRQPAGGDEELMEFVSRLTEALATTLDIEETLHTGLGRLTEILDAEAASIFLYENGHQELVCRASVGPTEITGLRMPADQGIVGMAASSDHALMVRDVTKEPHFAATVDEKTGFTTRSILCAPLRVNDIRIGAVELLNKRGGDGLFDDRDRYVLSMLASAGSLAIHNARMAGQLVEQQRIQRELELARSIQNSLFPTPPSDDFPITGLNRSAREVSGDFFDYYPLPDGRIGFTLADVSGKGMNAALLGAKAASLLRCLGKGGMAPGELLARVNEELCETASHGMFVTAVAGIHDPVKKTVILANAGHLPPLLHGTDGSFGEYPASAPPLGIVPGTDYADEQLDLNGGCLYLYTDGLTEEPLSDGGELGIDGLKRLISATAHMPVEGRLETLAAAAYHTDTPQRDDVTLLVVEA
jgi:sigma-B regulation protein RsbU (phosphoserine phosphatase)